MYEAFYRLREKPFALTPDPQYLYRSAKHRSGLLMLEYGLLNQASFCVLTGEVGCGKTLLIRQLLRQLDNSVTAGVISNANHAFGNLLQWICMAYGLDYRGKGDAELYDMYAAFLVAEYASGRKVVLVVDEAQNLGSKTLEELRVLSNLNADKHLMLQVILVGQPELRSLLRSPELRQFAQRISVDHHLTPFELNETQLYVWHRLRVAGGRVGTIMVEAINVAHEASGGIPRLINQLCDTALVYGYADRKSTIDDVMMQQVVQDRTAGGLFSSVLSAPEMAPPGVRQ
jgi:general secretion pathway protein A